MSDWNLRLIAGRLQQASLNSDLWPDVLDELSRQIGAKGAVLVSTEKRLPGVPMSPEIAPMLDDYFRNGWSQKDIRAERGVPLLLKRGVAADHEFVSPEEMRKSAYYQDWVERHGCRHWAGIGVQVDQELWCVALQRGISQGHFETDEMIKLSALCKPLNEAATLAKHLGFRQLLGVAHAFELLGRAAVLLDDTGHIIAMNEKAESLIDGMYSISEKTMTFFDDQSRTMYLNLISNTISPRSGFDLNSNTIFILNHRRQCVRIEAITLRDWSRFSFTSAKVLLLISLNQDEEISKSIGPGAFGLTPAERRLVEKLCAGLSLEASSRALNITYETARSYLKNIFIKTNTKRQGELVSKLLSAKYKF